MPRTAATLILAASLCLPLCAQKRPSPPAKKPTPTNESNAYPIVELTASGSARFDAEEILKATGLQKNKDLPTPLDDVKAAAQKLIDTGVFTEVNFKHSAAPGGMKVEFLVADKDDNQFMKADFANIVWFTDQDLLVELHDRLPLFNGTVPRTGTLADDVTKALQAALKEKGVNGNVASEHQDPLNSDPSTEAMIYRVADIDLKIDKVELSEDSPELQSEAEAVSKQIVGLPYNRATINRFVDRNLRNVYLKQGYLKATFAAPEIKVLSDSAGSTKVALAIKVDKGRPYKAGGVRWLGNKVVPTTIADSFLHLKPGNIVDGTQLAKDIEKLRYHYATQGYLHMTLTPRRTFDDNAGVVNYQMLVNEGDLFSMGKFEVDGLQPASAEKMRFAWKMREGDPFDPSYLQKFFKGFRFPEGTEYIVDEIEGEKPKSIDVTVIFCQPGQPCKSKNGTQLYTPPPDEDSK